MAPVTIAAGDKNAYYASGDVGWSARSVFAYHGVLNQLAANTNMSLASTVAQEYVSTGITPSSAFDLKYLRIALSKVGSPTDYVYVEVRSDDGSDKPGSTVLATSDQVSCASLTTTGTWRTFTFPTAVALSASTKYWLVARRTGAVDSANYPRISFSSLSSYGGGASYYNSSTGLWTGANLAWDWAWQLLQEHPVSLYAVTQDTSLHVWKSTDDGATWGEQDAADAPSVTNANYPFDATDTRAGPFIITARMTGTNTAAVRVFNMSTDQWDAADYGVTPPSTVSNERNIRVDNLNAFTAVGNAAITLHYTDSADDADIGYQRVTAAGNAWGSKASVLSITSGEASLVADTVMDQTSPGFLHRFFYDCANDDFSHRSLVTTTQGTQVDIDTTAAATDTKHASATYQPYLSSGVTTVVAAYIDSDDTIRERICSLDVTSASVTMASEAQISAATTTAGRQLSTCRYGTTNYAVVAVSGTGISYHTSTVAGTWSSATAWKTGLTNCVLSRALAIPDVGVLVVYTDNGDAKIDWIVGPFAGSVDGIADTQPALLELTAHSVTATGQRNETATTEPALLEFTGQTLVASAGATAATAPALLELTGQSVTATGQRNETAAVDEAALTLTGQSVVGSASVTAAIGQALFSLIGQAVEATGQVNETAVIDESVLTLTGQSVETSAGTTVSISQSDLALTGQSVEATGQRNEDAVVDSAAFVLTGQTVNVTATVTVTAETSAASLTLTGQPVSATGQRNENSVTLPATLAITGQTTTATGQRNEVAELTNATITITGQPLTASSGVTASVDTPTLALTGQTTTATGQRNETASLDIAAFVLTGQSVTATGTASQDVETDPAQLTLVGQSVEATGQRNELADVDQSVLQLLGQPVSVTASTTASISQAPLILTGQLVDVSGQRNETAIVGQSAFSLVGHTVTVEAMSGANADTDTASFTFTGQAVVATGQRNVSVATSPTEFVLTGQPVSATGQRNETAEPLPTPFVVEGKGVEVTGETNILPLTGSFTLTGLSVVATGEMVVTDVTLVGQVAVYPYFRGSVDVEPELSSIVTITTELEGAVSVTSEFLATVSVEPVLVASMEIEP
jgi:hypothetical protein